MEQAPLEPQENVTEDTQAAIRTATAFLTTLFEPSDLVLYRPIETWTEAGRKRSQTDYKNTLYRPTTPPLVQLTMLRLLELAEREAAEPILRRLPAVRHQGTLRPGLADPHRPHAVD